ncbi:efflux RND transporter periplasmic adaptor subunit [bacterium]|nr:efflux RND transporter periplasmic adaptor subunit [bacterium]
MKKLALPLALVLAASLPLLSGCDGQASSLDRFEASQAGKTVTVPVTTVVERDFERTITGTGSLRAGKRTRIQPHVTGQIVALPVDIGDVVQKGDVLVQLRRTEFENEVAQKEAELAMAEAQLADLLAWKRSEEVAALEAAVDEASAALARAENDFRRKGDLFREGGLARTDFDRAQEEYRRAQAALAAAQARLQESTAGPTREEIAIARARVNTASAALAEARRKLADTTITAPYTAAITAKFAEVGEQVNAQMGTDILEISDISTLEAYFLISETLMPYLSVGTRGTVEITSTGRIVPATVVAVNPAAEETVRSFVIKAEVANPEGALRAGLFIRGTLALDRRERVPAVPRQALRYLISDGEGPGVDNHNRAMLFVLDDDNLVHPTIVATGLLDAAGFIEIATGVPPGQRIVADGALPLIEGQKVQPATEGDSHQF